MSTSAHQNELSTSDESNNQQSAQWLMEQFASKREIIIHSTRDYDRFSVPKGQRNVNWKRVAEIATAMLDENFHQSYPIVVNSNFEILDGQHRFEAARRIKADIHYVINDRIAPPDVAKLARLTKSWGMEDFLKSYVDQGLPEYIRFDAFVGKYGLTAHVCLTLASTGTDQKVIAARFKEGTFQFVNKDFCVLVAERVQDFAGHFPSGYRQSSFVLAIRHLSQHESYEHRVMLQKMVYCSSRLVKCATVEQYVGLLEEIYNYKSRTPYVHFLPMR